MTTATLTEKALKSEYETSDHLHAAFGALVRESSFRQAADLPQLIQLVEQIEANRVVLQNSDAKWSIESAIGELCTHYIASFVSQQFPLIPPELFQMKRWLNLNVSIPSEIHIIQDDLENHLRLLL